MLEVVVADVAVAGVVDNGETAPAEVHVVDIVPVLVAVDVVGMPLGGPPCPTKFMTVLTTFGSAGAIC